MQGWTPDFIPKLVNDAVEARLFDEIEPVPGAEAMRCAKDLARAEGILCGTSGGATFAAALAVARRAPKGTRILAMLPDTGERYLSTPLFAEIGEAMDEEERAIAASTPRFRFDSAPAPAAPAPAEATARAMAHLERLVTDPDEPVLLFALEWCEFSWSVRRLFAAAGIAYRSVDLDGPDYRADDWGGEVRRALACRIGAPTIPQVFVGGHYLGGATETLAAFNDGTLGTLLAPLGREVRSAGVGDAHGFLPAWLHPRGSAPAPPQGK
jgi:cysteine synthase A